MSSITQNQVNLWIEQSRTGDREAFARIVTQFQAKVCAVTFSMTGNLQQSEDIAQETFLTAWRNLGSLQEPEKLGAWLCGIARTLCKKWFDHSDRDPLYKATPIDQHDFEPQLSEETLREKRQEQVNLAWAAIADVPQQYREPLVLYYREGRSVREVAETLELSENCVKQRLHRGRQFLKQEVERLVETALESTRPGERFTVAVLAAIPVLATSSEVFAAGSAASTAGAAAKSSGGASVFASTTAYINALIGGVFFPLAVFFGVVFGAWNGVRNSPTLRSRRFMLKATVFQAMMGLSIYTTVLIFGRSSRLFVAMNAQRSMEDLFLNVFFTVAIFPLVVYCVVSSYIINRRWRQIVEEDANGFVDMETLEQSNLSLRSLRKFLYRSLTFPFITALSMMLYTAFLVWQFGHDWWNSSEFLPDIFPLDMFVTPLFAIVFFTIIFYFATERKIRDEKSLDVWRPQIPNFLHVLKGEEKPQTALRFRTNLWIDLLLVGVGLCMIQGALCANYFFKLSPELSTSGAANVQSWYWVVFGISFAAYLFYAIRFAGIARKRYFGFIYLGLFQIVLCIVFLLFIEPWLFQSVLEATSPSYQNYLIPLLLWLSGFVGVGVAGLLAFRRKKETVA